MRNWIVNHFAENVVIMYDDDCKGFRSNVNCRAKTFNVLESRLVVENTAQCAIDAGARVFGWNQQWDPRKFKRNDPIKLTGWVGGVLGVIGKAVKWDELLKFKCDIDMCLQELMSTRFIYVDNRFSWEQGRDKNLGGNSIFRSPEKIEMEKRYLKEKWKDHIRFGQTQTQDKTTVAVQRTQSTHFK